MLYVSDVSYPIREGKGSGVWPSMVTHTWNLSSAFNSSEHTPGAVGSHIAAPGEQLGDRCLAQLTVQVHIFG